MKNNITIKEPRISKVFMIKLGTYCADSKVDYYESPNRCSLNVVSKTGHEALALAGDWILKEEKSALKEGENVFVESVELIANIDLFIH